MIEPLGPINKGLAEETLAGLIPRVLPEMARWAAQTVYAVDHADTNDVDVDDPQKCAGYRDLEYAEDGTYQWEFPRSNSSERISAFLWLSKRLNEPTYRDVAIRYAKAMTDDPVRGIYQGDEEDGLGQVWYWRDVGVYVTNYTIRVTPAFLELADETGEVHFQKIAELAGKQLIISQQKETGILREGWTPRLPEDPTLAARQKELSRMYISDHKINSRVGYATLPLVQMHLHTGEQIYRDALAHFLEGMERYQNPDGSFPEDIATQRFEVIGPQTKGHFHHYILNGTAKAACLFPQEPALTRLAERVGWYLAMQHTKLGSVIYGDLDSVTPTEGPYWHSSVHDGIVGLAWLSKLTNKPFYREIACRIALQALLRTWQCPDNPDLHGAIPHWILKNNRPLPSFTGHFHFMTILGLQALEQTATPSDPLYRTPQTDATPPPQAS